MRRGGQRGVGRGVGEGGFRREDQGEVLVEVIDQSALRAEVSREAEAREGQVAEALGVHGADESLDACLAEEVDGLAWVADQEDGLPVAVPTLGKEFDEFVLGGGGVLHLVDEEVLEACAESGGEVFWAGVGGEGVAGEEAEFGEVALVARGEDELEFDQRTAQNAEEGFSDGPLVCGVVGGGKGANFLEGEEEVVAVAEGVE